jgi:hypothetical protein
VSNPFRELKSILSDNSGKVKTGKVLRVTSDKVFLLVDGRARTILPGAIQGLQAGDEVSIQGETVVGKIYRRDNAKVYYV